MWQRAAPSSRLMPQRLRTVSRKRVRYWRRPGHREPGGAEPLATVPTVHSRANSREDSRLRPAALPSTSSADDCTQSVHLEATCGPSHANPSAPKPGSTRSRREKNSAATAFPVVGWHGAGVPGCVCKDHVRGKESRVGPRNDSVGKGPRAKPSHSMSSSGRPVRVTCLRQPYVSVTDKRPVGLICLICRNGREFLFCSRI